MLVNEFKDWLLNVKKISSVGARISNVKKVNKVYNLDNEYILDKCSSLLSKLYKDKVLSKTGVVPTSDIVINGDYYTGLGSLISAVKLYVEFLDDIKFGVNTIKNSNKINVSDEYEFIEYLKKIGITTDSYVKTIRKLKKLGYDLSFENIDNLITAELNSNSYKKDHGQVLNALKRYKEHYIYINLKEIKDVPDEYLKNLDVDNIVIPSNVKRLGNRAFYNSSVKNIYLEEGSLSGISGSFIFEGCKHLKKVYSKTFDSLKFRYDTCGHPYFKGVKVYVNNKEISPIVYLKITKNSSVWQYNSKHISSLEIIGDFCIVTYTEKNKAVMTKNINLNKEQYYELFEIMKDIDKITQSNLYFIYPTMIDATNPAEIDYKYFDEEGQNLKINFSSQNNHIISRFRDLLINITNENVVLA